MNLECCILTYLNPECNQNLEEQVCWCHGSWAYGRNSGAGAGIQVSAGSGSKEREPWNDVACN